MAINRMISLVMSNKIICHVVINKMTDILDSKCFEKLSGGNYVQWS